MERCSRRPLSCVVAFLPALTVALLCLAWPTSPAGAQGRRLDIGNLPSYELAQSGTVVTIDPLSVEVDVGYTTTVDIRVEDVTDLYSAEVYLLFDPALLEVVDADPAEDDVQIQPGDFLSPSSVEENWVDQDEGEIGFSQVVSDGAASGSGVLATITFLGKAGGVSDLKFDDVVLRDSDDELISTSIVKGSITITGGETPTPTSGPTPTATHTPGPISTPTPVPTASPLPTATAAKIESYVLQVWPDRSIGVISGLLEGSAAHADVQELPFGVFSASAGEIVRARTYLHFPLDVFPPGTQVLKATLFVYVDSSSDTGEAEFGAYRALDPWGGEGWNGDPVTWPALLTSPIAVTTARFDVMASGLPTSITQAEPLAPFSKPAGHGRLVQSESVGAISGLIGGGASKPPGLPLTAFTSPISPLPTPTLGPTATPAGTPAPTGVPTPTPGSGSSVPIVVLEQVEGTWLEWDVTALMRAWLAGEVDDYGLALASAPSPGADPEVAGNLLLARLLTADDPETRPYLIADIEVHPVTPTPTPAPVLPYAGGSAGWGTVGFLLVGVALLALGLIVRRRD